MREVAEGRGKLRGEGSEIVAQRCKIVAHRGDARRVERGSGIVLRARLVGQLEVARAKRPCA